MNKWYKYVTWIMMDENSAARLTEPVEELGGACRLAVATSEIEGVEMVDGTALFEEDRHRSAPMNGTNGGTWRA